MPLPGAGLYVVGSGVPGHDRIEITELQAVSIVGKDDWSVDEYDCTIDGLLWHVPRSELRWYPSRIIKQHRQNRIVPTLGHAIVDVGQVVIRIEAGPYAIGHLHSEVQARFEPMLEKMAFSIWRGTKELDRSQTHTVVRDEILRVYCADFS